MFRKFALAALAAAVGMVVASILTGGKHTTLSELLGLHNDRPSPVAPVRQIAKPKSRGAKKPAASPSPVAQTVRSPRPLY
jgi:hypothetical protein